MLSAFFILAIIVFVLAKVSTKRHKLMVIGNASYASLSPVPLTTASMILGIGLGGFIDGIILHQILQWHEMLTNKVPNTTLDGKSINMFWDGIFHFFCLFVVLTGLFFLWKLFSRPDANKSGKLLIGGMILGWGLFNIVEGVIDHHLLRLHNVKETTSNPDFWNYGFIIVSLVMLIVGYVLVYKRNHYTQHNKSQ
jgi:uncharacterized membrane protein